VSRLDQLVNQQTTVGELIKIFVREPSSVC
jgi:hypothetical protein